MTVEIRPIQAHDEYWAVEQLQREVWGLADVEIVPNHLLLTAQKNGGLLLGAFDVPPEGEEEQFVGFVFGFVGLSSGGGVKHCSHMAGVAPAYQNQNLGYRLKLAQRQQVLSQGIDLATWTFDPLESRNANLNFRKLGATSRTYLRDLYGSMRNTLNVGLPSDRFQVDWHIASRHVAEGTPDRAPSQSPPLYRKSCFRRCRSRTLLPALIRAFFANHNLPYITGLRMRASSNPTHSVEKGCTGQCSLRSRRP